MYFSKNDNKSTWWTIYDFIKKDAYWYLSTELDEATSIYLSNIYYDNDINLNVKGGSNVE